MAAKLINGNLFDSKADVICHQCNCKGVMGSGVALEVKNRYPHVFNAYRNDYLDHKLHLGYVCFANATDNQVIANLCGQDAYGYGSQFTDYTALATGFTAIREYMLQHKLTTIAFPYKMSCARGGGDWKIVSDMINTEFANFNIEIWKI